MVNTETRLIIFFAAKDGEALYIQSTKTRPGADCGSDHELLITKFRLKLKKVEKTARPFRYDLNHIHRTIVLTIYLLLLLLSHFSHVWLYATP